MKILGIFVLLLFTNCGDEQTNGPSVPPTTQAEAFEQDSDKEKKPEKLDPPPPPLSAEQTESARLAEIKACKELDDAEAAVKKLIEDLNAVLAEAQKGDTKEALALLRKAHEAFKEAMNGIDKPQVDYLFSLYASLATQTGGFLITEWMDGVREYVEELRKYLDKVQKLKRHCIFGSPPP